MIFGNSGRKSISIIAWEASLNMSTRCDRCPVECSESDPLRADLQKVSRKRRRESACSAISSAKGTGSHAEPLGDVDQSRGR